MFFSLEIGYLFILGIWFISLHVLCKLYYRKKKLDKVVIKSFQPSVAFLICTANHMTANHVTTNHMTANHMTGFYVKCNTGLFEGVKRF